MNDTILMVDAVIFDLDGTLIDSIGAYFGLVEEVCCQLALSIPSHEVILEVARSGDLHKILPEEIIGGKDGVIDQAVTIIRENFPRMFEDNVCLVPGAANILEQLHAQGMKIGIVTSTHRRFIDGKMSPLRRAGVADLIESVICIEDVVRFKPEPDPLLECAVRLGVAAGRSVYIGDSYIDIKAGKAAGMKTVGVLTGMDSYERLKEEEPDLMLGSVRELTDRIYKTGER